MDIHTWMKREVVILSKNTPFIYTVISVLYMGILVFWLRLSKTTAIWVQRFTLFITITLEIDSYGSNTSRTKSEQSLCFPRYTTWKRLHLTNKRENVHLFVHSHFKIECISIHSTFFLLGTKIIVCRENSPFSWCGEILHSDPHRDLLVKSSQFTLQFVNTCLASY